MIRYARFDTPLGALFALSEDGRLRAVHFEGGRHAPSVSPAWACGRECEVLRAFGAQLGEYLAGARTAFELPLAPRGTPFQLRAWEEIARIPYGETLGYAALARRCGLPAAAARAAGAATGRNPLSIVVPCHRVVGSGGALTGYAGGVERKAWLVRMEAASRRAAA